MHERLDSHYFKNIDSKEKAYWLGFLCADAHITQYNSLRLHLSVRDEDQMDRFINAVGASLDAKRYYGPYDTSGKSVMLHIADDVFVGHLKCWGCDQQKTKNLTFPMLGQEARELAFLMGFFDGDGNQSDCHLYSSNLLFLGELAHRFGLETDPIIDTAGVAVLNLRTELFLRMLENYPKSMPRKRRTNGEGFRYTEEMEKVSDNKCSSCGTYITRNATKCKSCRGFEQTTKIDWPDTTVLRRMVTNKSYAAVARTLGVSGNAVRKRIKNHSE